MDFDEDENVSIPPRQPNCIIKTYVVKSSSEQLIKKLINGHNIKDILSREEFLIGAYVMYLAEHYMDFGREFGQTFFISRGTLGLEFAYRNMDALIMIWVPTQIRDIIYRNFLKHANFTLKFDGKNYSDENKTFLLSFEYLAFISPFIKFLKTLNIIFRVNPDINVEFEPAAYLHYIIDKLDITFPATDLSLYELYQKQVLTDFAIQAQSQVQAVHRNVFYVHGGLVVKTLLSETYKKPQQLDLSLYSNDTVKNYIAFVYIGDKYVMSGNINIIELYYVATYLQHDLLVDYCRNLLSLHATTDNIADLEAVANDYKDEYIRKIVVALKRRSIAY